MILVTLVLAVFVDLVTAVAVGLVVSVLTRASEVGRVEFDNVVSVPLLDRTFFLDEEGDTGADPFAARVGFVDLRGYFSMASANELLWAISADIQDHEVVILDFSSTVYMDDSAARVMEKLVDAAGAKDTECIVKDLSGPVEGVLVSFDVFRRLPKDRFVAGRGRGAGAGEAPPRGTRSQGRGGRLSRGAPDRRKRRRIGPAVGAGTGCPGRRVQDRPPYSSEDDEEDLAMSLPAQQLSRRWCEASRFWR